ncbi:hypothetical protein SAMN05421821_10284 [Mucilaginibacter lappiensis]|uniref:Uncharacterized protein n=1 Tax=Mucilaginibacter lappiensis TaxID=354630 RepID=A0ABR6PG99_9SPHI|nr:hypothetical protein [Mucilaginibacter lappiensis]MBB6108681.1 hypothetical protein [Mucilaginibacter lappiensis]SIQ28010.1 hypothetical protein SAMN05421821_10284 [Mucilaginibacter lappiensis]
MESSKFYKLVCCFLLCAFSFQLTQAQTFAEWFSQKKTQIKYLTQQIAALAQYSAYVKQGYAISQNGLGSIGGYIKGEYGLHNAYYSSLKTVNAEIKGNSKADSIMKYAAQIPVRFDHLNSLTTLDNNTRTYVAVVKSKVLDDCNKDLSELQMVIGNGQAQMTDDERLKRLDGIYERMKDKFTFTLSFCSQVRTLLLQRQQELNDINTLKQQYGIN